MSVGISYIEAVANLKVRETHLDETEKIAENALLT